MSNAGTPRYELAKAVFIADNADAPNPEREWDIATTKEHAYAYAIADGLITAGWTKPRTVTEYGIVFNRNACSLIPPALSLDEFKERYPHETGWSITDRDTYLQRTRQEVDPEPGAWEVMTTEATK